MTNRYLRSIKLSVVLLVLMAVLLPSSAFAAANVFDVIQSKLINTVKDIRQIAYVIAGFGLIMFTVLAIFNKISFKHLGYIMISLSLLALMMPFINYFSGAKLSDDLDYGTFLAESSTQQGSPDFNKNPEPDLLPTEDDLLNKGVEGLSAEDLDIAKELAPQTEEEKKSFKERVKDTVAKIKKGIDTVGKAIDTAEHTKAAVEGAVVAAKAVNQAIKNGDNVIDTIANVSAIVDNASANVGSHINGALGSAGIVAGNLGNQQAAEALNNARQNVTKNQGNVTDWTNMGRDVGQTGANARHQFRRLTGQN